MDIFLYVCSVVFVIIIIFRMIFEWKSYLKKKQKIMTAIQDNESEISNYESKKSTPNIGDEIAQEMFQRLKKKELDEKISQSNVNKESPEES